MSITDQIKNIPESEKTPLVIILLEIIQQQAEEIQHLKDETARLKGQKPKPRIKPSNLVKETDKIEKNKEKRNLEKTCRKLGISFLKYLDDRVLKKNNILPLAELMKIRAAESTG